MQEEEVDSSMDCAFCEQYKEGDLLLMMTDAVYAKHTITQNDAYINYIDAIMRLQEPTTKEEAQACCRYHEYIVRDERDQFMKRQYSSTQFQGKINMLTEYYKFHSNIPRVIQPKIQRVLSKYHDKKREYDYKRIKKLLKEEQGISITSVQESQSDYSDQQIEKKSRYSTLLNEMDQSNEERNTGMSDSNVLKDLCKQIEKVLPSKKKDNFKIKGAFYHDTIFEKYLKKEQMKTREQLRVRNQERKASIANAPKRLNLHLFSQRNKREKENPFKQSKQLKRREKEVKPVFNTNIKIQIKNAMFCTEDHFKNINFESQNTNGSKNLIRNDIFKKKIMGPLNFFDSRQPSSKFLTQIYKPSQNDSKRKITPINQQRTNTKQSINRSQSKERRKTLPKQSFSQSQLKRGTNGSHSARKIVVVSESNQALNKGPGRALSSTNLKSRSLSSQSVSASASLATSSYKKHNFTVQKRPIQLISKYGSSNLKQSKQDNKRSEQKMNDAISRKLTLKVG